MTFLSIAELNPCQNFSAYLKFNKNKTMSKSNLVEELILWQVNIRSGLKITADHQCGGGIFQNIFSHAENILKNPFSTLMIGSYFEPC